MIHWTDTTDVEAAEFFATLSEREIRTRQDLCTQQIGLAWKQRNDDALADLRRMEDALAAEMMRRLDEGRGVALSRMMFGEMVPK